MAQKKLNGFEDDSDPPQRRIVPIESSDDRLGLTELLRACLDRRRRPEDTGSWKHRLIASLLVRAEDGDIKALQEIWTRLEGKPGTSQRAEPDLPQLSEEVALKILLAAGDDGDDAEDEAGHDDEDPAA
jgi:hypothetical protein